MILRLMVRHAKDPGFGRGDDSELPDLRDLAGSAGPDEPGGWKKLRTPKKLLVRNVTIAMPAEDKQTIERFAAEHRLSIGEVCRRLLAPAIAAIREGVDPLEDLDGCD